MTKRYLNRLLVEGANEAVDNFLAHEAANLGLDRVKLERTLPKGSGGAPKYVCGGWRV